MAGGEGGGGDEDGIVGFGGGESEVSEGELAGFGGGEINEEGGLGGGGGVLGHSAHAYGYEGAAGDGHFTVVVEGTVAGIGGAVYVDFSAGDGDVAVAVDAVAGGVDVEFAAGDGEGRAIIYVYAAHHASASHHHAAGVV